MIYGAMNSPVKPVLDELRSINELGFDYLELTMDAPEAHYERISEIRERLYDELKRQEMEIVIHLPTFVSTADLTPSIRKASLDEILNSLEVAASLNPLKAVLHPGRIGGIGHLVRNRIVGYAMDSLEIILKRAKELHITLCLENMFPQNGFLSEPSEFVTIFNEFPDMFLTFDTGHAHLTGGGIKKTLEFINMFGARIGHVHVSDNFGTQDNHLPIGTGSIDFPSIIKGLRGINYNETVTFEVFSRDKDYLRISREKFIKMFKE